jgi:hypothetical protein
LSPTRRFLITADPICHARPRPDTLRPLYVLNGVRSFDSASNGRCGADFPGPPIVRRYSTSTNAQPKPQLNGHRRAMESDSLRKARMDCRKAWWPNQLESRCATRRA